MKPGDGRKRVVIEQVLPQVDCGRYAVKRVLGDLVKVTAVMYGDGHDKLAGRLMYKHASESRWRATPMSAGENDVWSAVFPVDKLGEYRFTVHGWVDHFATWREDFKKRLAAASAGEKQDIPLALRIGANLLEAAQGRARSPYIRQLKEIVASLRWMADENAETYEYPLNDAIIGLADRYPDVSLATKYDRELRVWVDRERARFSSWYELFPRSASTDPARHGTFADVQRLLPSIAAMGFDVVYLPPIHPIGHAYRKGKNNSMEAGVNDVGSPWAIGSQLGGHKTIHPELGTLADFEALVAGARGLGMEIALDIALQCSPDHPWVVEHPEWFVQRPDGTIQYAENPPKKYQDIYPLNFETPDWRKLWEELHSVFDYWARHGVKIFRVDNPHTKAMLFWEWCIAELHREHPEIIFLAEAFTRPHVMYGLAKVGFTQSYTYFTWRTTKAEIQEYFEEIMRPPVSEVFRANLWPNTPDILHASLQTGGRNAFMQRLVLAGTLGANYGVYGPPFELAEHVAVKAGSEEYLNSEKYEVRHWARGDAHSLAPLMTLLNRARRANPALQSDGSLHFHGTDNPPLLCYSKSTPGHTNTILVCVNLDAGQEQSGWVELDLRKLGIANNEAFTVEDLLTGQSYQWRGRSNYIALRPDVMPAHVFRISHQTNVAAPE